MANLSSKYCKLLLQKKNIIFWRNNRRQSNHASSRRQIISDLSPPQADIFFLSGQKKKSIAFLTPQTKKMVSLIFTKDDEFISRHVGLRKKRLTEKLGLWWLQKTAVNMLCPWDDHDQGIFVGGHQNNCLMVRPGADSFIH